jgi:hypothetical protein
MNAEIYLKKREEQTAKIEEEFYAKYKYLLSDSVQDGPFQGLNYPFLSALQSTLYPKLMGFYEFELHELLNKTLERDYNSILDIGSADGYYAVWLAIKFQNSIIYVADVNPEARGKTKIMAEANGIAVNEKFQILKEITPTFLLGLDPNKSYLLISDCEGYEFSLFTDEVIANLRNSDFIIQMHDFIHPGFSDKLKKRFKTSHFVQLIKSIDDVYKYRRIQNPKILEFPIQDQITILAEKRPTQMEWIFCEPLKSE